VKKAIINITVCLQSHVRLMSVNFEYNLSIYYSEKMQIIEKNKITYALHCKSYVVQDKDTKMCYS